MVNWPVRVLVLIDHMMSADGGTEWQLSQLLKGLDRSRFSPELLALYRYSDFVTSGKLPFPADCLDLRSTKRPGALPAIASIVRRLRRGRFSLLHTYFPESVTMGPFLAAAARIPHVTSRRDLGFWYTSARLLMLRTSRRFTRQYIANSNAVRDSVIRHEGARSRRVTVIPNPIDLETLSRVVPLNVRDHLGLPASTTVIVLVANLRPVKGVDTALRAVARLVASGHQVTLVCVGYSSRLLQPYRRLCTDLGIADHVVFVGHLPRHEALRWVGGADIGLNSSHSEGLSNSICEAMALGRPMVATAVGGNPELVHDGESGLLVPPRDHAAMAEALSVLIRSPHVSRDMGSRGLELMRGRGGRQEEVRRYQDLYTKVLTGSQGT